LQYTSGDIEGIVAGSNLGSIEATPWYVFVLRMNTVLWDIDENTVASKNLAGTFVNNLLSMIESQSNTQAAIQKLLQEMADLPETAQSADRRVDLTIQQSDLQASSQRLSSRIAKGIKQLTEKDHASAAVLMKAQRDKFLSMRLRARALKHRIRSRIRERRFESERLVRAYFRAALGMSMARLCNIIQSGD
jgi:hypothetical protein